MFVIVNIYKQKIKTPDCFAEKRKAERFIACDTEILTAGPRLVKWYTYGPGRLYLPVAVHSARRNTLKSICRRSF